MRTMNTFWGVVLTALFCFGVIGAERAWATIAVASGAVAQVPNGSITIGTGGTLNVPLTNGITYPGGSTISVGIGFTGFDFNNEVNAVLTTGIGFNAHQASGNCGFQNDTAGAKVCVGPGANMDIRQDANGNLSMGAGAAYVASATPFTLSSVYINNIPLTFVYGGGKLPAHAFTVQAIRFNVRTAGSGGSTNVTFEVSDGTNTCDCSYACNHATGSDRASCATNAGTGCAFAASAALVYKFTAAGDCALSGADLNGNIDVEGVWQ